ncbi:MAG: hypothetical protein HRT61_24415, partial [Ekhidna sp.]|nr:hypothetical protein [Ekhidna sp.]
MKEFKASTNSKIFPLDDGKHTLVSTRYGFVILDQNLRPIRVEQFEEPSWIHHPYSADEIVAVDSSKVVSYSLDTDRVKSWDLKPPVGYADKPMRHRYAYPTVHHPNILPYVYRPEKKWTKNLLMGWNHELNVFTGGAALDWRTRFRFGIEEEPILELRANESNTQTAYDVHYQSSRSNGALETKSFTRSLQTTNVWIYPGHKTGQGLLYLDGDVLGPGPT